MTHFNPNILLFTCTIVIIALATLRSANLQSAASATGASRACLELASSRRLGDWDKWSLRSEVVQIWGKTAVSGTRWSEWNPGTCINIKQARIVTRYHRADDSHRAFAELFHGNFTLTLTEIGGPPPAREGIVSAETERLFIAVIISFLEKQ